MIVVPVAATGNGKPRTRNPRAAASDIAGRLNFIYQQTFNVGEFLARMSGALRKFNYSDQYLSFKMSEFIFNEIPVARFGRTLKAISLKESLSSKMVSNYIHFKVRIPTGKQKLKDLDSNENFKRQWVFESWWNRKTFDIYKSIEHHFIKTHLWNHVKCIDKAIEYYCLGNSIQNGKELFRCNADAYLIWRMNIENSNSIRTIYRNYNLGENKSFIEWNPPNCQLPALVMEKIFELECYWLFYESKLLATMARKNGIGFTRRKRLSGYLLPYWIVTEPEDNQADFAELHWWIDRNALKKFEREIKH